jgi:cyclopropane-fatty-acyl-phospholipid synthase
MANQEAVKDRSVDVAKELSLKTLEGITQGHELRSINVRLWDGSYWPDARPRAATLVLNRPSALKEMLMAGTEAGVGEAYIHSAFDVEGDMEAAFELADILVKQTDGWSKKLKMGFLLQRLPDAQRTSSAFQTAKLNGQRHSTKRDRAAIRFHYDVSNDFYRLWLDRNMVYSCAYFSDRGEDLETAQENKCNHICRKLGLKTGHRLLDIGCGWGGLLIHAAKHFGVKGEGITLSQNQLDLARQRIAEEGLEARVSVRLLDYRELPQEEAYDALVSVGMVEHVGVKMLAEYFQRAYSVLKPGGLFLNHGIGQGSEPLPAQSGSFIQQYVFPDTDLLAIGDMLNLAERARFEIRDVESLREHYALTLRHWVRRLDASHEEALKYVDEAVYRIWKLYMNGCAHGFQIGQLSIYQTLLAKLDADGSSQAPFTRDLWYCE